MLRATRSRTLPELPEDSWDENDDLVSPCSLEAAVVKALATTHASVTAFTADVKCRHDEVADDIFAVIISGMISVRLGVNKIEAPDIPGDMLATLCSICKEMMKYKTSTVKMFTAHYITYGTSGFDDLISGDSDDSDDTFHFFLLFMDIKSIVSFWTGDLPPKKKIKRMGQKKLDSKKMKKLEQ